MPIGALGTEDKSINIYVSCQMIHQMSDVHILVAKSLRVTMVDRNVNLYERATASLDAAQTKTAQTKHELRYSLKISA